MLCYGLSIGVVIMRCVATDAAPATAGAKFCDVAVPHYWSTRDARDSKVQADIHNAKGKKLCGWQGKPAVRR